MGQEKKTTSTTKPSPLFKSMKMGRYETKKMSISESKFNCQWQMFLCIKKILNTLFSKAMWPSTILKMKIEKRKKVKKKKNIHSFLALASQDR